MRFTERLPTKAKGRLKVTSEDRAGHREVLEYPNTVVEGFYIWALRQAAVPPNPTDPYRETPERIALGSNPDPTDWDMVMSEVQELATVDLLPNVDAPDNLALTLSAMFDFDEANGPSGNPMTYWEIALVSSDNRLLARVVGRNPDGSPAGLTKSNRQRLYIDWTIYWVVE